MPLVVDKTQWNLIIRFNQLRHAAYTDSRHRIRQPDSIGCVFFFHPVPGHFRQYSDSIEQKGDQVMIKYANLRHSDAVQDHN